MRYCYSLLILIFFVINLVKAQPFYSYIEDRKFRQQEDLIGYDFRPIEMQPKNGRKQQIAAGAYSFGITANNLYVDGEGMKGVYNVNSINPAEYGFILALMNVRNPAIQGHLKVILNEKKQADALVFKQETKAEEVIFFLQPKPEKIATQENAYFTNKKSLKINDLNDIWGQTLRPLFQMGQHQRRLQMNDSLQISFIETWRVEDKRKKPKAKKGEPAPTLNDLSKLSRAEVEAIAAEHKNVKILLEHKIIFKEIVMSENQKPQLQTEIFVVTGLSEREDETASADGERYQIVATLGKSSKKALFIYLTPQRTVSSVEFGQYTYQMMER